MSKTVRNATLESPAKRATLMPSGKPYWKSIDAGLHLGYRKGTTKGSSGKWVARRYLGGGQYKVETIGVADDHSDANGADILNFFQAQRRARDVAAKAKAPPGRGDFTVAAALTAYFARLEHEGSKSLAAASHMVMAGVPLNVVAHNLGHADTRMTEKHYAHLAPSYVAAKGRRLRLCLRERPGSEPRAEWLGCGSRLPCARG